jgi:D-lactate dehydrogenase (cytochrome)
LIAALKARFAERCSTALVVREQHGRDESSFAAPPPSAVVFAESTQDVADAVKLAGQYNVPVIPYGAGTSLEGHMLALRGGVSIDLSQMNRIIAVNAEDLTVTVQPGVTRKQLNAEIATPACSFRSTRAPTPRSAAWPPRALQRHECRALRHHAREHAGT